ncbi:MAG: hypothetical protein ACE5GX_17440 [Thermoanaerobaculia bacterium]
MTTRSDSWTLAKALGKILTLPALAVISILWLATPSQAQIALEVGQGSARIWRSGAEPESLALGRHHKPRFAVAAEGGVVIAGDDQGSGDLFFLYHRNGSTAELPTLPFQTEPLRTAPVLLTDGDRMEGVVWLEGTGQDDFSIRASIWNGSSWEHIEIVSPATGRAQLALASTVLDDGTWLVLWAGYDGTDDDIFWSRRVDGEWTSARRVHADNGVPDVLPTVIAHGDTAHAAWSFFDGADYRVRTARWNGSRWTTGETLDGRGTVKPELETRDGRSFVSYRSVEPEVWNLVELDRSGNTRARAFVEPYEERPLVVIDSRAQATLSWPWRSASRKPMEPRR